MGGAAESSNEAVWEIPLYNLAMNTTIQTQSDRLPHQFGRCRILKENNLIAR